MKLWRLARPERLDLKGEGAIRFGTRYSSPGLAIVPFASEPGLAVLIRLRYLDAEVPDLDADLALGWTEAGCNPIRVPEGLCEDEVRTRVSEWHATRASLLLALSSKVLPEADVVLMNPDHPDARSIPRLTFRRFRFSECLHRPPMIDRYGDA